MKKYLVILGLSFIILFLVFVQPYLKQEKEEGDFFRIHIRANSNLEEDQYVKYLVKDKVVEYLTPYLANCESFDDVENVLSSRLNIIESISDTVLKQNGFTYSTTAKINNEYFPTRSYAGYVLDSGYYDALILEIGEGVGDNWWCVVYPPLCFVDTTQNVVYKSKFLEIIKKFFG